jgi:hypothetical protein
MLARNNTTQFFYNNSTFGSKQEKERHVKIKFLVKETELKKK